MFIVSAAPAPTQPLTVTYSTTGSATFGLDYTLDGTVGQIVIPAGQSSAGIHMHSYPNSVTGKAKTIKLKLSSQAGYKMPKRNGKSATVKIVKP
jgi:hypothetical protein